MAKTSIYKTDEGKNQVLSYYETLLLQWHQPFCQLTIETTFGETYITESGEKTAPKLILLHGSSSNSAMWIAELKNYQKPTMYLPSTLLENVEKVRRASLLLKMIIIRTGFLK